MTATARPAAVTSKGCSSPRAAERHFVVKVSVHPPVVAVTVPEGGVVLLTSSGGMSNIGPPISETAGSTAVSTEQSPSPAPRVTDGVDFVPHTEIMTGATLT